MLLKPIYALTRKGRQFIWGQEQQTAFNEIKNRLQKPPQFYTFAHLLERVDFDVVVDHLALMYIMKSKVEPATTRIKRLLDVLGSYSFNLYYIKGKDMILSDFLSRYKIDDSNPHEIIPISFDMRDILQNKYYRIKVAKVKDI